MLGIIHIIYKIKQVHYSPKLIQISHHIGLHKHYYYTRRQMEKLLADNFPLIMEEMVLEELLLELLVELLVELLNNINLIIMPIVGVELDNSLTDSFSGLQLPEFYPH